MRYDRLEQFITDEDRAFFKEATDYEEIKKRHAVIEQRYYNSFGGDMEKVKEEALFLIGELERQDLLDYLEALKERWKEDLASHPPGYADNLTPTDEFYAPSYQWAWEFISGEILSLVFYIGRNIENADKAEAAEKALQEISAAAAAKAGRWYAKDKSTPDFMPILRTKPTSTIGLLNKSDITFTDPVTKAVTYTRDDVQVVVHHMEKATAQVNINLDKLLCSALAAFYQSDHSITSNIDTVKINFDEYARARGYDIDNPNEKKRKNTRDRARKNINMDLKRLTGIGISWKEKNRNNYMNYANKTLVQEADIIDDNIVITFSTFFADFLRQARLVTQYPTKLLSISAKDPNTYKIGKKLIDHYNQDNNRARGTNDIMSVKALLKVTELQSYEALKAKNNRNWDRLIKKPFETALENLVKIGILNDWHYCHEKKVILSDDEIDRIYDQYENFESLYILFDPADKIDHSERLEHKAEKIEKAKSKSKKKR